MVNASRRAFLRGAPPRAAAARRPPWALLPESRFVAACTRCGDCVRACPQGVLKAGEGGFPVIGFDRAGCTLCGECALACPSGAIGERTEGAAFGWRVNVGAGCLALHGVECRLCGDACDARALRFVPALGGIAQMRIDLDACTGCGACVSTCPVQAIDLR